LNYKNWKFKWRNLFI